MNKRFLGAALAMGALLTGQQASQPNAADTAPLEANAIDLTIDGCTVPVESVSFAPAIDSTTVTVKARPLAMMGEQLRFIEKPGRRKAKCGKRRWVIMS